MQSFITFSVTSAEEAGRDKEPGILSWHQLRLGFTTKGANLHDYLFYQLPPALSVYTVSCLKSVTRKVIIYLHHVIGKLKFREVKCGWVRIRMQVSDSKACVLSTLPLCSQRVVLQVFFSP